MKTTEFRKLTKGDIPGMPPAFYTFMDHIQQQVDLVSQAVTGRLNDFENSRCEPPLETSLVHGVWSEFKLQHLRTAPRDVAIIEMAAALDGFQWERKGETRIRVRALFEGAPATPVAVTIKVKA